MFMNEFLKYKIIDAEFMNITVYHLLILVLILSSTYFSLYAIKRVINREIAKKRLDKSTTYTVFNLTKYFLWIIAIFFSLDSIGIKMTFLMASSAALLVGIGLGLQKLFNDIVSGIILLFEGNLKIEDVVEVNGNVGKVEEIGLRSSRISTLDNVKMLVPNSKFINEEVINWSHLEPLSRYNVKVGVAYGSNVLLVTTLLLEAAKIHPLVCKTPVPEVQFRDFGDSALMFSLFFWLDVPFENEVVKSDIRYAIDRLFRKNNILIPFPQRDVHIYSTK